MLYEFAGEATEYSGGWLPISLAADVKTFVDQLRFDEPHEQTAIKRGSREGKRLSEDRIFKQQVNQRLLNDADNKDEKKAE